MASQWLYITRLTRPDMLATSPTEEEQRVVAEHAEHVSRLADRGIMFLVGRQQIMSPTTMGFAMFFAADEAAARNIMESDPAIIGGVMSGELFPYKVAFGNVEAFAKALTPDQS